MSKDGEGQINDLILTFATTEKGDGDGYYAMTKVYRWDIDGDIDEIIKFIEERAETGGQLGNR